MNGKLIVSEHGRDRIHELCDEQTIVGRGMDSDLHLKHPDVAAEHCAIKRTPSGFKVVDLETNEGTKVNGHLVNQHVLQNGDTIQVGAVRITYLGDSGAPGQASRKAPPPPLTSHPTNAEGEPHRFYRHEQKAGLGSGTKVALILAALGILALILVSLGQNVPNEASILRFQEARRLLENKNDPRSIQRAIEILKNLPPGAVQERDRVNMVYAAESRLLDLGGGVVDQKAEIEFTRIMQYYNSHKEDIGYLKGQVRSCREHFPASAQLLKLEATLEDVLAGGEEGKQKWSAAQEFLRHALKNAEFKGAFETLAQLEGDAAMLRIHGSRIATYRRTFERAFKSHFEIMTARALSAHERGKTELAQRIYAQLADVGLEPYASQARTLLESLDG
ncbi:MAG: FHA domain-containing protein [Planctomycetes bacterium]|nr:FHA domain-containing protein [Planctomycetota bacterium]